MKILVAVGSYERILFGIDVELSISEDGEKVSSTIKRVLPYRLIRDLSSVSLVVLDSSLPVVVMRLLGTLLASFLPHQTLLEFLMLRGEKDVGSLSQHDGSVTALAFAGSSHLLTGGEDGRIGLFRTKDWECLHVLRHKKPIHSLAVHPSKKVLLSVGKNRSIKLWNLMTCKQAHASKLTVEPLKVIFSESGSHYAVLSEFTGIIFSTDSGAMVKEFKSKTRLASGVFLRDDQLYVAGEGNTVQIIKVTANEEVEKFETNQNVRIKDLCIVKGSYDSFVDH